MKLKIINIIIKVTIITTITKKKQNEANHLTDLKQILDNI